MSQSISSNIVASGIPIKNVPMGLDYRDGTYKGIEIGYHTSGMNYITGSSIVVIAANTSGTFRAQAQQAKKVIFVNQRDPMYRVYKNNETGVDYRRWLPCGSGGWDKRVEIEGIQNLQDVAIQSDNTATTSVSGVCIVYS